MLKFSTVAVFSLFYITLVLLLHPSTQQSIINSSSTIEATCIYSYDYQNRYSCQLLNAVVPNPTDILTISGTHLPGKFDSDVQVLTHTNASFSQFNGEALRKFTNLKFIDLRRVGILTINENAFEICGQLEELHMGFNGFIEGLAQGMLRNCASLRTFWAPDLRILSLPEDLFGNSRNLEVFDMSSSPLRSFPDNVLQNMTNLRIFRIPGNYVSYLHQNNLINAANLEKIDIAWNTFNDTQNVMNLLNGHLGLRKIRINSNYFEVFDFRFFTQFQRLEELNIGGRSQMTSISWQFLPSSLRSLTVLQIGENIPENAFENLQNLEYLSLTGFGITKFEPNTFRALNKLDELSISFTSLKSLHPQQFTSQTNLRLLFLVNNQIEALPDGVFEPLVNLGLNTSSHGLNVAINNITKLSINAFGRHPHLDHITFSHNDIDEIERGLFSRFSQKMAMVDFGFNRCISNLFWNVTNVDEIEDFQRCFDNFDGITTLPTTTPPDGCGRILVLLTLNLQPTTQQELISKSNVIETHCILSFDPQGNYNCYLFNVRTNYSDVLNIVGSHLQNLTDADVHGVIFTNSMINQFKGEVFQKFTNLKHLNLRGNFLQSISANAFESCEKLEELYIGSNPQLLDIPSKMLSNCENLKTFTMTYGYFRALPDDLFGSASSLEVFNAANGRLTSIPDNLFQNMSNLRIFNIWNCPLRNINPRLFENVAKDSLEEINISGALLSDQQEVMDLLDGHLGLKKLLISSNSLPMFNLSFFTQFDKLEELSFSGHGNQTKMDWHALPSSLKILNVFRIIEEIPENAFEKLTSLIHLYITGDGITNLQKDTLKPLSQLERLEIVSTNLSTLHPELFTSQLNLGYLRLDYNEIEELPEGIFAPLINLGLEGEYAGLYVVRNKLKSLSANIFGQHPYLKRIDFSYNQINKIERGIFSRIHPVPEYANFFQNECINWYFRDEDNLDQRKQLELCFNNYDGILTTTPGGAGRNFGKFEILFVILVGFVKVLMEYWQ